MGLLDGLTGGSDTDREADGDDDGGTIWKVIARDPATKQAHALPDEVSPSEWEWTDDDVPTKEQFQFRYGDYLEPGVLYILAPKEGKFVDFDSVRWSLETEAPSRTDDDLEAIRQEIRALKEEGALGGDLREAVLGGVVRGQVDPHTAQQVAQLNALWESGGKDPGNSMVAEADVSNPKEIMYAGLADWFADADNPGELIGNTMSGALGATVGPGGGGGNGQQPPAGGGGGGQQQARQQQGGGGGAAETAAEEPEGNTDEVRSPLAELAEEGSEGADGDGDAPDRSAGEAVEKPTPDEGETPEAPDLPAHPADLQEFERERLCRLAKAEGYPGNAWHTKSEELRDWLIDERYAVDEDAPHSEPIDVGGDDADDDAPEPPDDPAADRPEAEEVDAEHTDDAGMAAAPTVTDGGGDDDE